GQRGRDLFVREQRVRHVAEHGEPVARGAVEFPESVAVSHGAIPFCYVRWCSSPAGGQFSSFMPSVRPREASTSLISLSDLRPRFGVFRSSVSVRWIRSPM